MQPLTINEKGNLVKVFICNRHNHRSTYEECFKCMIEEDLYTEAMMEAQDMREEMEREGDYD